MTETARITTLIVVGLCVGSFLNVCIHRLPRGGSLLRPRSRCPGCDYELHWYDNIPVLSYLLLLGRCRRCKVRISVRYPIVELVTAAVFLLHYMAFGWTPLLVVRLIFACALIVLFAIDLEHQILPDVITLPGIVAGLIFSLVFPPGILDSVIGMLLGGGSLWLIAQGYYRATGQEGMGGGDVKMLAMVGAFLGWPLALLTLILASLSGALIGSVIIASRRGDMKYAVPFGTFLALGAVTASLVGPDLIDWYMSLYQIP